MSKMVARGYITEGVIIALASFLYVPKGTENIHMVFDVTIIGIKDYLWAKYFCFH